MESMSDRTFLRSFLRDNEANEQPVNRRTHLVHAWHSFDCENVFLVRNRSWMLMFSKLRVRLDDSGGGRRKDAFPGGAT